MSKYISASKYYFANILLVSVLLTSIVTMFHVQFKVENINDRIEKSKIEISVYEDKIQILEVEWVYLTRPGRLRDLASKYLTNNNYAQANQIKNEEMFEKFAIANYQKLENENRKMAATIDVQGEFVSF
jgi:hypothetical protein